MVPTFTCGFLRSNVALAMSETSGCSVTKHSQLRASPNHSFRTGVEAVLVQSHCPRHPALGTRPPHERRGGLGAKCRVPPELPQGLEPWTSTLPRWRSTTELWQRGNDPTGTPRART